MSFISIDASGAQEMKGLSVDVSSHSLQLTLPSSNTLKKKMLKKKARSHGNLVTLDGVIMIPKFYADHLTYEKMQILQDLLARKTR